MNKNALLFALCLLPAVSVPALTDAGHDSLDPSLTLWLDHPASEWTEALPVGNGRLGAMIYGGSAREIISFNEDTLWTGQPHDYANPGAHEVLDDLRQLLRVGEQEAAHALGNDRFMSEPFGQQAYQPFGRLLLEFPGHRAVTDYRRALHLEDAVATVDYAVGERNFHREVFASEPDQAIIIRLSADGGRFDFAATLDSPQPGYSLRVEGNQVILSGRVRDYPKDEERGSTPYPESGLRFEARLEVVLKDGTLTADSDGLRIEDCSEATLRLVAATNFVHYDDISGDPAARCEEALAGLSDRSYAELKARHLADYRELFQRVSMNLGFLDSSYRPTDQRVQTFKEDNDPSLVALVFQYGRYLLISSSRPGSQPANLQGIWNHKLLPPWDSKYTTNINVEMNYWPAEVTQLPEMAQPLIEMVKDLSKTGQSVAREHYDLPGWVTHHNTDLWRAAAPINHANHGIWVTGGAWLCQHLWWHYEFNGDLAYLKDTAYPIMKEASRFFVDYLVPAGDGSGWLISGPSNSPENGGLVMGPTMDHQIIRSLFRNTIEAAEILEVDADFARELQDLRSRIAPNRIGKHGQLQEWFEDMDDPKDTHRHVSHLWGLHPGSEIHPRTTPELADASRVTLDHRGSQGDGGRMGWSAAWKINFMARLLDGDEAFDALRELIAPSIHEAREASDRPRLYVNIFDANPPFQIEENFGATSGIAEMLLQSHLRTSNGGYYQDILPALPESLKDGKVVGLKGRGGFEFAISWKDGRLAFLRVTSLQGNPLHLRYADKTITQPTEPGASYSFAASEFL